MLVSEGRVVNLQRLRFRVYRRRAAGAAYAPQEAQRSRGSRCVVPSAVNERWSVDSVFDQLANGVGSELFDSSMTSSAGVLQFVDFSRPAAREQDSAARADSAARRRVCLQQRTGAHLTAMFPWSQRRGVKPSVAQIRGYGQCYCQWKSKLITHGQDSRAGR